MATRKRQPEVAPLTPEERLAEIERLATAIAHHNERYWDDAAPEISDADYDVLVRKLRDLDPTHAILSAMGPKRPPLGAEVRHRVPMLSLEKCYGDDDLRAWVETFDGDVAISPKFDGIACSLHYEDGRLVQAATRGDGVVGEDITRNARGIADIPKTMKRPVTGPLEVRGEIFMRTSVFATFKGQFSNPRNLTAGAIKHKDHEKSRGFSLSFAAYELFGTDLPTERAKLDRLVELGFAPIECKVVPRDRVVEEYRDFAARRAGLDFEIDGIVLKADRASEQLRLGSTSHHPRWAIAYKFQGDTGTTVVRAIEWSVARTGAITPVAIVDPVMLSGAMVSRASLHHPGYLKKLDPDHGGLTRDAEVEVTRRGGVIPNVERVIRPGAEHFTLPEQCPSCGKGPLVLDGDFAFCPDPDNCKAAVLGRLGHFLAATGIEGFGERYLAELYDRGLARTPAELYAVKLEDLLAFDRVGEKVATKLVASVDEHRTLPLDVFLRALGIDELGKHVSGILASEFKTLDRVRRVTAEELAAIHSIGETIATTVTEGLKKAAPAIDALLAVPVTVKDGEARAKSVVAGPFTGKSFVFTGKMASLDRRSAQSRVVALGGLAPEAVNANVTHLVVGDDKSDGTKSSKEKAAEKLKAKGTPIEIISETDFAKMVEEATKPPT